MQQLSFNIDEILEDFEDLSAWDERFQYLMELGDELPPFPEEQRVEENRVQGCTSMVWMIGKLAAPKAQNGDSSSGVSSGGASNGSSSSTNPSNSNASNGSHAPVLELQADSDSHIVRGLIAILMSVYSGQTAETILAYDVEPLFERLGLKQHLSHSRSNGLYSMVKRIRNMARCAAETA